MQGHPSPKSKGKMIGDEMCKKEVRRVLIARWRLPVTASARSREDGPRSTGNFTCPTTPCFNARDIDSRAVSLHMGRVCGRADAWRLFQHFRRTQNFGKKSGFSQSRQSRTTFDEISSSPSPYHNVRAATILQHCSSTCELSSHPAGISLN
jgi:hypothetical protein